MNPRLAFNLLVMAVIVSVLSIYSIGCGEKKESKAIFLPPSPSPGTGTGTGTGTGGGGGNVGQDPSGGSGGATGDSTQTLGGVAGCLVHTPTGYTEESAWSLLMTSCGNPGTSPSGMTKFWNGIADSKGFIVCSVPHANITNTATAASEGAKFSAARDEMYTLYNVDRNAAYANGFSGGGQVAFYCATETSGWAGNICFSSAPSTPTIDTASGPLPIYWKNAENDPYFPWSRVSDNYNQVVAAGHNVHGHSIWPAGSAHDGSIQNANDAWTWTTNPANRP